MVVVILLDTRVISFPIPYEVSVFLGTWGAKRPTDTQTGR